MGHAKKELLNFILTNFSKERQKFEYYMSNKNELERVLNLGAEKSQFSCSRSFESCKGKVRLQ
jgi:tryptophanyl-tRNA synthetase